jgi:hypothetical protein
MEREVASNEIYLARRIKKKRHEMKIKTKGDLKVVGYVRW